VLAYPHHAPSILDDIVPQKMNSEDQLQSMFAISMLPQHVTKGKNNILLRTQPGVRIATAMPVI